MVTASFHLDDCQIQKDVDRRLAWLRQVNTNPNNNNNDNQCCCRDLELKCNSKKENAAPHYHYCLSKLQESNMIYIWELIETLKICNYLFVDEQAAKLIANIIHHQAATNQTKNSILKSIKFDKTLIISMESMAILTTILYKSCANKQDTEIQQQQVKIPTLILDKCPLKNQSITLHSLDVLNQGIKMDLKNQTVMSIQDVQNIIKECQVLASQGNLLIQSIRLLDSTILIDVLPYLFSLSSSTSKNNNNNHTIIMSSSSSSSSQPQIFLPKFKMEWSDCKLQYENCNNGHETFKLENDQLEFKNLQIGSRSAEIYSQILQDFINTYSAKTSCGAKRITFYYPNVQEHYAMETLFAPIVSQQNFGPDGVSTVEFKALKLPSEIKCSTFVSIPTVEWSIPDNSIILPPFAITHNTTCVLSMLFYLLTKIPPFTNISGLIFQENKVMGDVGVSYVAQHILTTTNIQHLNLSNTNMTDVGLEALITMMLSLSLDSAKQQVTKLDISNNKELTTNGMKKLIDLLKQDNKTLKYLNITGCDNISNEAISLIEYYVALNRAGRRYIPTTGFTPALLPRVLTTTDGITNNNIMKSSIIYWILRQFPDYILASTLQSIGQKRKKK